MYVAGAMINLAPLLAQGYWSIIDQCSCVSKPFSRSLQKKRPAGAGLCSDLDAVVVDQPTLTSIAFGFAFSDLGSLRFRTPSLNSALTFSSSTRSGNVKLRTKLP